MLAPKYESVWSRTGVSKGSDSKYFRRYGPVAITQLCYYSAKIAIDDSYMSGHDCVIIKLYKKWMMSWPLAKRTCKP